MNFDEGSADEILNEYLPVGCFPELRLNALWPFFLRFSTGIREPENRFRSKSSGFPSSTGNFPVIFRFFDFRIGKNRS